MPSLKNLYKINNNLRGISKQGYCRPSVAELFGPSDSYDYPWCSAQPVWDNNDNEVLTNNNKVVTVPM